MKDKNSEVKTKKLLLRDLYKNYDSKFGSVGDDIHESNDTLISSADIEEHIYNSLTCDYSFLMDNSTNKEKTSIDSKNAIQNILETKKYKNTTVSDNDTERN